MMFISAVSVREEAAPRTTTAAGISPVMPGLVISPVFQVGRKISSYRWSDGEGAGGGF